MKRAWRRFVALVLSALILLPPAALAGDEGESQTNGVSVKFAHKSGFTVDMEEESAFIGPNGTKVFKITLDEGRKLDKIAFEVAPSNSPGLKETVELVSGNLVGSPHGVSIKMDAWPERSRSFTLTVSTSELTGLFDASINCQSHSEDYNVRIHEESGNAKVNGNETSKVNRGKNVSLSVVPEDGYRLKSLIIKYDTITETLTAGNTNWNGLNVTWNAEEEPGHIPETSV